MLDLSLEELRAIGKIIAIRNYKSFSIDKWLSILDKSEQVKIKLLNIYKKTLIVRHKKFVEEEDYYEPVKSCDAFNNNYTEYESNRSKNLSVKEYLDMIETIFEWHNKWS